MNVPHDIQSAPNVDLRHEKVVRWLTLLSLIPPFWYGIQIERSSWKPPLFPVLLVTIPLVIQIIFMRAYRRLNRNQRTAGMILEYIVLALAALFIGFMLYVSMWVGAPHGV